MINDEYINEDIDDEKTVEYIKNALPVELKEKYSDDKRRHQACRKRYRLHR